MGKIGLDDNASDLRDSGKINYKGLVLENEGLGVFMKDPIKVSEVKGSFPFAWDEGGLENHIR